MTCCWPGSSLSRHFKCREDPGDENRTEFRADPFSKTSTAFHRIQKLRLNDISVPLNINIEYEMYSFSLYYGSPRLHFINENQSQFFSRHTNITATEADTT